MRAFKATAGRRGLVRRPAHAAGARRAETLSAGKHDLARLQPHWRLRRVLSGGWPRLSAAACRSLTRFAAPFRSCWKTHPLSQAWAFKGLEAKAAIDAHADDAAISINFWVTPDQANLNPGRGGLVVCRVPPPAAVGGQGLRRGQGSDCAFLQQHASDSLIVPYRENRAVLFESRLFHRSDAPEFATGYENHRINLTLLFGRHAN